VRRTTSGSPFERTIGFSRAVRVGERVLVSGTAPVGAEDADAYTQTQRCLQIIGTALHDLDATLSNVVRTRMFITDARVADDVGRAHAEAFAGTRPAATMVVVAGLLDPRWKVEIEAEAVIRGAP